MDEWLYGSKLDGNVAILIGTHTKNSKINVGREVPFVMSIIYRVGSKRITNFLLDLNSLVYIKLFDYNTKYKKFIVYSESCAIETVDALFDQFEKDYRTSPILKSLDMDYRLCGNYINKGFSGIDADPHPEDLNKFCMARENLSYSDKLNQQLGKRNDPIEIVIKTLHCWDGIVNAAIEEHKRIEKQKQLITKSNMKKKTILKIYADPKSIEQQCVAAEEEIEDFQNFIDFAKDATDKEKQIAKQQIKELRKFISDNVNAVTKEVDNRMSLVFADQNQKTITSLDDLYSFSL